MEAGWCRVLVDIAVLGAINWDINLFVERFPEVGEEVPVYRITRVPGGKAANVAVAAARVLGPNRAALIGCLGKDDIAEVQVSILQDEGVVTSGIKMLEGEESGQAYILIDRYGRNMINTFFGANLRLSPSDLHNPEIESLLEEAQIITVIDPPVETIREAASFGKWLGKTVIWDAGVRSTLGIKTLREVLAEVDYVVLNRVEVKNLTGVENPATARKRLSEVNSEIRLIAKLGEKGCVMVGPKETIKVRGVNLSRLGMKVVNTVGCGDAFLGVFAASRAEGFNDKEALERANLAGAIKATRHETRGSPTRMELERFLEFKEVGETT